MSLYIKYHPISSCESLDYAPAGHDFIADESVAQLLTRMGLDESQNFVVFVNRDPATLKTILHDEDRIDIFPDSGGK